MITVSSIGELRSQVAALRTQGKRIGFVPTMGNLHDGHLKLVRVARQYADAVVASIFVNPMQFGAGEDFATYPRTPELDREALQQAQVDLLFMPAVEVVYPRGMAAQTFVEVPGLSDVLCGASRPGHFRGVATVVNRLFNLVGPDVAVFGRKDYQQLLIIRLMVADLGMPLDIVGVETQRTPDGLAMSSRNTYLSPQERQAAPRLYATLQGLRDQIVSSGVVSQDVEQAAAVALSKAGFRPDYLVVRRQQDLAVPAAGDGRLVILAAAHLGKTRLIDNLEFDLNPAA